MQKNRNPFIAAFLSAVAPGLGQIYNGRLALGIGFYLISLLSLFPWLLAGFQRHFPGLAAYVVIRLGFWLFVIGHAFIQARRVGNIVLRPYNKGVVYLILILFVLSLDWLGTPFLLKHVGGINHYRLPATSMEPTCQPGDILMVDIKSCKTGKPQRGDLVIFKFPSDPSKDFFKRVIALEGEKLEIKNKQVYVNGESLSEPYKVHKGSGVQDILDNFGPLLVPAGYCFVMGDNRDFSVDSRSWGPLPLSNIKGNPLYIYWAKDIKRIGLTPK